MELLNADNISYHNGNRSILDGASFKVVHGRKYGLIGPNGAGKTTLIRLLTGELTKDGGTLAIKKKLNWSLVPQQPDTGTGHTIATYMLKNIQPYRNRLTELETAMGTAGESDLPVLFKEYETAQDNFERMGGYTAEDRIEGLLDSLGLCNDADQNIDSLSGGEQSLLFFARSLLNNPELLILDEPGNHLDYLGLAWLEQFIRNYKGAVLVVSHNRYMLDKICDEIWDIENSRLTTFTGSYSTYKREKLRAAVIRQSEYEAAKKEAATLTARINQLQSIAQSQYNPPKTIMVELGACKGKLERVKQYMGERPETEIARISWRLNTKENRSNLALEVNGLTLGFGDKVLLKDINLTMHSGEKTALVGLNGSGKTTLLRKIITDGDWDNPQIRIGPSHKVGYLSQTPQFRRESVTVEDEVRSWGPLSKNEAFEIINRFLFGYNDLDKPLKVLSGGETNRLQLARLMYLQSDFLILDEPTNHMDITSREVMEEVLQEFPGTMLVVSHDRFFLDGIAERVVEIRDQKLETHLGNFSEFFRQRYSSLPRLSGQTTRRKAERQQKNSGSKGTETALLEQRIQDSENVKIKLERDLQTALENKDHLRGRQLATKLEKEEQRLENLYRQWEKS